MDVRFFQGISPEGFHKLSYAVWGKPRDRKAVICVHGLTRNKSDFAFLAEDLSPHFHVASLDVAGRGQSDFLKIPNHYNYAQYLTDANALIARLDVDEVYWIGTSMGGLIGLLMAALPNSPIKRLVLNDIGPYIPREAVDRIKQYASIKLVFKSFEEGTETLKQLYTPFGKLTEEQWAHVMKYTLVKESNGTYTTAYDPTSAQAVEDTDPRSSTKTSVDDKGNIVFWDYWDKITCPVLVINGKNSDILPPPIVEKMRTRGPKFDYYLVEDAGHAPALMAQDQRDTILKWLTS